MTGIDLAGHVVYAWIAFGVFLLAKQKKSGWVWRFFGELGWVVIGFFMGMSSIWFWGLVFMVLDAKGYIEWRRKEKE